MLNFILQLSFDDLEKLNGALSVDEIAKFFDYDITEAKPESKNNSSLIVSRSGHSGKFLLIIFL